MSHKELHRSSVLERLLSGKLSNRKAALEMDLHVRQVQRLKKRYVYGGAAAIAHRSRGRPSPRCLSQELQTQISQLLQIRYPDFGPTFAAEKLKEEYGVQVSIEYLRQAQIKLGLRKAKKRKPNSRYYPRRTRRSRRGELIQIDGSDHQWFENRAGRCTLLSFIDDATSEVLFARFVPSESYQSYASGMKDFFEREGLPVAFYSDKHGVFWQSNKGARDKGKLTELGKNLGKLKIETICANSPQAKGRIERSFGTHQDRLVKELRLAGINDQASGNQFLDSYIRKDNGKFSVPSASPISAFTALDKKVDLNILLGREESRTLSKSLSFQYNRVLYQALNIQYPRRAVGAKVQIRECLDGGLYFTRDGKELKAQPYCEYSTPQPVMESKDLSVAVLNRKSSRPHKNHPWR